MPSSDETSAGIARAGFFLRCLENDGEVNGVPKSYERLRDKIASNNYCVDVEISHPAVARRMHSDAG